MEQATSTNASAIEGKWGCSNDRESYSGAFDTREEAAAEARASGYRYIGSYRAPTPPEEYFDACDLIDHIMEQDEYCGEYAEGCFDATEAQLEELTLAMRQVFATWLDRHGLRPAFGLVDQDEAITI